MTEFIKGAYNVHEHNHADEIAWPTERLEARIADIRARMAQVAYSGERLRQNERELDLLSLELTCRYAEETNKAWDERDGILETQP